MDFIEIFLGISLFMIIRHIGMKTYYRVRLGGGYESTSWHEMPNAAIREARQMVRRNKGG